jgi:hypothetical protein
MGSARQVVNGILVGAALLLSAAGVPGQVGVGHAAPLTLGELSSRVGASQIELQRVSVPLQPGGSVVVPVTLGGQSVQLELQPHSLRADVFKVRVPGPDGVLHPVAPAASRTWRGRVLGLPGSLVAATLHDGQLQGLVDLGPGLDRWGIQPADALDPSFAPDEHLVYAADDLLAQPGHCGGGLSVGGLPPATESGGAIPPGAIDLCQIAVDSDFEYFQIHGSVDATVADIETVLNAVAVLYYVQTGIQYELTEVIVRTDPADPYNSADHEQLLLQMQSHWNASQGSVVRDTAHLFTGREIIGNVVGVAFVGVICNTPVAYGYSQSLFSSNMLRRVELTTHELGHNWSAGHCDLEPDCGTMCSAINSCNASGQDFGSSALASIADHRAAAGCLSEGGAWSTVDTTPFLPLSAFGKWLLVDPTNPKSTLTGRMVPVASPDGKRRYRYTPPQPGPAKSALQVDLSAGPDGSLMLHRLRFDRSVFSADVKVSSLEFTTPLGLGATNTTLDLAPHVGAALFSGVGDGLRLEATVISVWETAFGDVDAPAGLFLEPDLVDWTLAAVLDVQNLQGGTVDLAIVQVTVRMARDVGPVRVGDPLGQTFLLDAAILPGATLGLDDPTTGPSLASLDFDLPGVFTLDGGSASSADGPELLLNNVVLRHDLTGRLQLHSDATLLAPPFGVFPADLVGNAKIKAKTGTSKASLRGKLSPPGAKPVALKAKAELAADSTVLPLTYKRGKELDGVIELTLIPAAGPEVALVCDPFVDISFKATAARKLGAEGTLTLGGAEFPVVLTEKRRTKKKDGSRVHVISVVQAGSRRKLLNLKGTTPAGGELTVTKLTGKLVGLPVKPDPADVGVTVHPGE